jgi:hypothetical protein
MISLLVLRALNVPHIETLLGVKRKFFVTVAYRATKKRRTKSVQIEGQTAVWNQTLDAL